MGFVANTIGDVIGDAAGAMTKTNQYNVQTPEITRQDFSGDINYQRQLQQASVEKQNQVYQQQQALAGALAQQAAGGGPNPAMAQYQQNVNNAGAQSAGLIASQKGISPALAARMAAQQQSGAMQGAAAQGAQLQAQQQLAAQQALQNQQLAMQQGSLGQGNQALTGQNIFQGAQANQNNAINTGSLGAQGLAAGITNQNTQAQNTAAQGIMQGISGGIAAAAGKPAAAYSGGEITSMGAALKAGGQVPGRAQVTGDSPQNDTVHALLSPGEIVIPRSLVDDPEKAKKFIQHIKGKKSYGDVLKARKK